MLVFNIWIRPLKGNLFPWKTFSSENPVEENWSKKWNINVIILMHFLEPSQSPVGVFLYFLRGLQVMHQFSMLQCRF